MKNKISLNKKEIYHKGITLIALIIIIVVLLILAGVTITTLTGDNGLITKVIKAREETQKEQYFEEINLEIYSEKMERINANKEEKYINSLKEKIKAKDWVKDVKICNERVEEFEDGNLLLVETKDGHEIIIYVNNDLNTANIKDDYYEKKSNNYFITYDNNGGKGEIKESQEIRKGFSTLLKENVFSKTGYKFIGWSEDKEGTGTIYAENSEYIPKGSVTLYAIWEKDIVTLSFNANSGSGTMNSIEVAVNQETTLPKNAFVKQGYVFTGWNTKSDGTGDAYSNNGKITINSDTTLYAQWKIDIVTVNFNGNSGTGSMNSIEVVKNEEITLPKSTFVRTDYVFTGWNTKSDGSGTWYFEDSVSKITANVTLYAQWIETANAYYAGTTTGKVIPKYRSDTFYNGNFRLPSLLYDYTMLKTENIKYLNAISSSKTKYQYIYSGTQTYTLTSNSTTNTWIGVKICGGGWTTGHNFSGFKLIFANGQSMTLTQAINSKYVDPLVVCASSAWSSSYVFNNMSNVLTGGSTNTGNYCTAFMVFKVKGQPLSKIQFYANQNYSTTYDGVQVIQMPTNWNLSKTKW